MADDPTEEIPDEPTLWLADPDADDTGELPTLEDEVIWDDVPADDSEVLEAVPPPGGVTRSLPDDSVAGEPDEFETMEMALEQRADNVIAIDTDPVTEKANERKVESWTTERRSSRRATEESEESDEQWHEGPTSLDDFTQGDYLAATTTEYQGLADAVKESETQDHEQQAVFATMPGMDSGIVGFEDVTGEQAPTEMKERVPSDLPIRIITAIALVAVLFFAVSAGGGWLAVLITVVAVVGLGEFYAAARRVGYVPVAAFGLAGVIILSLAAWFSGPGGIAGAIVASTMAVLLWYSVLVRRDPLENAAITVFGLVWVGGLLAFAVALSRTENYRGLVVGLVLIAAAMDIGAYFVGRSVGKTKLAPELSPKKTVEGLVGGAGSAVAMAALLSFFDWFTPLTLSGALWVAVGVIIAAPLGDLAESMVKRSFGIKDMGSILPGHGGVLDRIDALLFVVPIGYYVYEILGYLG